MSDKPTDSLHHITFYGRGGVDNPHGYKFTHVSGCNMHEAFCPTRRAVDDSLGILGLAAESGTYEVYLSEIDRHLVLGVRVS